MSLSVGVGVESGVSSGEFDGLDSLVDGSGGRADVAGWFRVAVLLAASVAGAVLGLSWRGSGWLLLGCVGVAVGAAWLAVRASGGGSGPVSFLVVGVLCAVGGWLVASGVGVLVGAGGVRLVLAVFGAVLLGLLASQVVDVGSVPSRLEGLVGWLTSPGAGVVGAAAGSLVVLGTATVLMSGRFFGVRALLAGVGVLLGVVAWGLWGERDRVVGVALVGVGVLLGVMAWPLWSESPMAGVLVGCGGVAAGLGGVAKLGVSRVEGLAGLAGPVALVVAGGVGVVSGDARSALGVLLAGVVLGVSELVGD